MVDIIHRDWAKTDDPEDRARFDLRRPVPSPTSPIIKWQRDLGSTGRKYHPTHSKTISNDVLLSMRLTYAAHILDELIEINTKKAGGAPVVVGTRFKVAQLLAELADGHSISYISRQFGLDKGKISELLDGLSVCMDRSFVR